MYGLIAELKGVLGEELSMNYHKGFYFFKKGENQ